MIAASTGHHRRAGLSPHRKGARVVDKPSQLSSAFDQTLSAERPVVIDVRTDFLVLAPPAVV
jgi:thiamine pyrophosphate-dependent acetolactate synthase large subunit-like protein